MAGPVRSTTASSAELTEAVRSLAWDDTSFPFAGKMCGSMKCCSKCGSTKTPQWREGPCGAYVWMLRLLGWCRISLRPCLFFALRHCMLLKLRMRLSEAPRGSGVAFRKAIVRRAPCRPGMCRRADVWQLSLAPITAPLSVFHSLFNWCEIVKRAMRSAWEGCGGIAQVSGGGNAWAALLGTASVAAGIAPWSGTACGGDPDGESTPRSRPLLRHPL